MLFNTIKCQPGLSFKITEMHNYRSYRLQKITEVNLSAFVYRLFHEDFSPILGTNGLERHLHETVCKQMQIN